MASSLSDDDASEWSSCDDDASEWSSSDDEEARITSGKVRQLLKGRPLKTGTEKRGNAHLGENFKEKENQRARKTIVCPKNEVREHQGKCQRPPLKTGTEKRGNAHLGENFKEKENQLSLRKMQELESRNRELEGEIQKHEKEHKRARETIVRLKNEIREHEGKYQQSHWLPIYKMKGRQRGMCVIINNINFRNKTWYRKGTTVDEIELRNLFEDLFFNVVVRNDLKWDEMRKVAAGYAAKDHREFDAFVLVVMSHGGDRDVIYGVEGRTITVEDLMCEFNAANCPTLRNKPKLFFIQTCRGELKDESNAATLNNAESDHSFDSPLPRSVCPKEADFLLAFSTTPGYVAYRDEQHGSPYIQTLVEVMRNRHNHDHVLDMLTEVNRLLAERSSPSVGLSRPVQMPAPVHTLRAKLYL